MNALIEPSPAEAGAHTLMHTEAQETSQAVARMLSVNAAEMRRLAERLRAKPPRAVLTIARGSSDNACTYGRYLIEAATGLVGASAGPSLGSIYDAPADAAGMLCIAVSQSGASPDLLGAVRRVKDGGAIVVGLVNQPASPLSQLCDVVIGLEAGPERSVAATKSCLAAFAAMAWLAAEWTGDGALLDAVQALPEQLARAWTLDWSGLGDALQDARNLYVLGRGPGLGAAQEAALKLKETCGLHAEAFSTAEVLHGPMALVSEGFPILCFAQGDASLASSREMIAGLAGRGAHVLLAGTEVTGTDGLPVLAGHPALEPLLSLQSFYRAAANLSVARGLDPDRPPHLSKVTRTH